LTRVQIPAGALFDFVLDLFGLLFGFGAPSIGHPEPGSVARGSWL